MRANCLSAILVQCMGMTGDGMGTCCMGRTLVGRMSMVCSGMSSTLMCKTHVCRLVHHVSTLLGCMGSRT